MNKFSERLHYLRVYNNLTYKDLAAKLGVSERLIYYWERGQRECSFDMLIKLSEALSTSIDFILGKTDY